MKSLRENIGFIVDNDSCLKGDMAYIVRERGEAFFERFIKSVEQDCESLSSQYWERVIRARIDRVLLNADTEDEVLPLIHNLYQFLAKNPQYQSKFDGLLHQGMDICEIEEAFECEWVLSEDRANLVFRDLQRMIQERAEREYEEGLPHYEEEIFDGSETEEWVDPVSGNSSDKHLWGKLDIDFENQDLDDENVPEEYEEEESMKDQLVRLWYQAEQEVQKINDPYQYPDEIVFLRAIQDIVILLEEIGVTIESISQEYSIEVLNDMIHVFAEYGCEFSKDLSLDFQSLRSSIKILQNLYEKKGGLSERVQKQFSEMNDI